MNGMWISSQDLKPAHMRAMIVHRADETFPFLHDTMIACLGGKLLMAWYNCTENEIVGRTVIRGRWSDDNGATWSEPEIICEDFGGIHMVPVTFSEYDGVICAYVTMMTGHDLPIGYVCLQYTGGKWTEIERRSDPVLLNTIPESIPSGWIAGGRIAAESGTLPMIPVVALAEKAPVADWRIIRLPGPWLKGDYPLMFPETTVLVGKNRIDALARSDRGAIQAFSSTDGGETWSEPGDVKMPVAPSKLCGGVLPDGRQFLIYNEETVSHDRSRLVMAVRENENSPFSRVWTIADGFSEQLNAGPMWHYPCACVSNGYLHISCTASSATIVRHAALYSIPLSDLV